MRALQFIARYRGAVTGAALGEDMSSPITIMSPWNGGIGLIGNCGRKTPKLSDASTRETNINTAAHFMFLAGSRTNQSLASQFLLQFVAVHPVITI